MRNKNKWWCCFNYDQKYTKGKEGSRVTTLNDKYFNYQEGKTKWEQYESIFEIHCKDKVLYQLQMNVLL